VLTPLSLAPVPLEISVGSKVKILQTWEEPCLVLCKELMALDFFKIRNMFCFPAKSCSVLFGKRNNCVSKMTSTKLNIPFILFHHSWYFWVFFVAVVLTSGSYLVCFF